MKCYLCSSEKYAKRPGIVRDNPNLDILECTDCGLVYLSATGHIDEGFYKDSGMHTAPVVIEDWIKNTEADDRRRLEQLRESLPNQRLLDFGCGNRAFLMMARTLCRSVAGVELEKRLQPHFRANSLQVFESLRTLKGEYDWITAFHVVEHLSDPISVLKELAGHLKPETGRIAVEVPSSDDALLTLYQCRPFEEFTYWSCHLYLFNPSTLRRLAGLCPSDS